MAPPQRRGSVTRNAIGRRPGIFPWRPTPIQAGLGIAAVVTAGGVLALPFVASHASGRSTPVPVVTAIMSAPHSVAAAAAAPATSPASPAHMTQPPSVPVPSPADSPAPAGPAPATLNQPDTAAAGQQAATQAATGHQVTAPAPDVVARHPASRPVRDQAPAREPRPVAPPASPAAPLPPPSPSPSPSEDQQSPWNWNNSKKTTTCDSSGRCVDHYNPEPNSTAGPGGTAQGTDQDQQPRAVCTYWDAQHNTSRKAPC